MSVFVFVSFSAKNAISFSSAFLFTAGNEKMHFRSASNVYHKKVLVLVLVLRCKVLVLVLNIRLGLGLEIKVLVLILVLKKSLAYITVVMLVIITILKDTETFQVLLASVCCAWSITAVKINSSVYFLKS